MATVRYFWLGFIHSSTTFVYFQYSHPSPYLSSFVKASCTISTSMFDDVLHWPLYSTDTFAVVLWLWQRDHNRMDLGVNDDTWWHWTPSLFMTMQGFAPLLSRISSAAGNGIFWNSHRTHSIWVHAITTPSPKRKNHCEGPSTTQEINLCVL